MSSDDFDAITEYTARSVREADKAVSIVVAVVVGILSVWALLVWATPCEAGSLCMAAAIPTQPSVVRRFRLWLRALRLRLQLSDAENALAHVETDLQELPELRSYLLQRVDLLRIRLADCDLGARRN